MQVLAIPDALKSAKVSAWSCMVAAAGALLQGIWLHGASELEALLEHLLAIMHCVQASGNVTCE